MDKLIKKYFLFVFIIIAVFVFAVIKFVVPTVDGYFNSHKNIKTKQEKIAKLKKDIEAAKLAKMEAERKKDEPKSTKVIYEPNFKSGDVSINFNNMLDSVLEMAKQSGLKVKSIEFKSAPESDLIVQNHPNEYLVKMLSSQFIGTYTQFQSFMREIYRHQYLIGINDFKIVPYEFNKKVLIIDMNLTLYMKK